MLIAIVIVMGGVSIAAFGVVVIVFRARAAAFQSKMEQTLQPWRTVKPTAPAIMTVVGVIIGLVGVAWIVIGTLMIVSIVNARF